MQTVIETPTFLSTAKKLLDDSERQELVWILGCNPMAGDVMAGTGGVRKLRIAREDQGKSGGFRVIYYYYNESLPLFLLTIYPKNQKANLSAEQRNKLAQLVEILKNY